MKDAGIVPTVAAYLTQNAPSDLVRTVCGFYLNSSMDYGKDEGWIVPTDDSLVAFCTAPIQNEIAECGAAKSLVDLIVPEKEDDGSITMAIKVLDNMVAEGECNSFCSFWGIDLPTQKLLARLFQQHLQWQRTLP